MTLRSFLPFARRPCLKFSVQFYIEPDGDGYHAFSPALRGLHADGNTEEEAARSFAAVVPAYLESLAKHGDPLPIGVNVEMYGTQYGTQLLGPDAPPLHVHHVTVPWPSQAMFGTS